jgi:hypothetical protein
VLGGVRVLYAPQARGVHPVGTERLERPAAPIGALYQMRAQGRDGVYNPLFRATSKRLVDYPRLAAFVGRFYELPRAETVRLEDILTHYYDGDWAVACRRGIVPRAPAID